MSIVPPVMAIVAAVAYLLANRRKAAASEAS
jgi:hypothetical protein